MVVENEWRREYAGTRIPLPLLRMGIQINAIQMFIEACGEYVIFVYGRRGIKTEFRWESPDLFSLLSAHEENGAVLIAKDDYISLFVICKRFLDIKRAKAAFQFLFVRRPRCEFPHQRAVCCIEEICGAVVATYDDLTVLLYIEGRGVRV